MPRMPTQPRLQNLATLATFITNPTVPLAILLVRSARPQSLSRGESHRPTAGTGDASGAAGRSPADDDARRSPARVATTTVGRTWSSSCRAHAGVLAWTDGQRLSAFSDSPRAQAAARVRRSWTRCGWLTGPRSA